MSVPGEWSGHAQSWPASESPSHCTGVGSTANNSKAAQEWRNKLLIGLCVSLSVRHYSRTTGNDAAY